MDYLSRLLESESFMPRVHCGPGWEPWLITQHVVSDLIIFGCYVGIPAALVVLVFYLRPGPRWVACACFWIAFILSCGATHWTNQMMFRQPAYRLDGLVKTACAMASLAALAWVPFMWGEVQRLRSRWKEIGE